MTSAITDIAFYVEADFSLIPLSDCKSRRICLGKSAEEPHAIYVISSEPSNVSGQQFVESLLWRLRPSKVVRLEVDNSRFEQLLLQAESRMHAMDSFDDSVSISTSQDANEDVLSISLSSIESTSNPIVRLVDSTLYDALKLEASDVHFEVQQNALTVKYRIDGVLQEITRLESLESAHQVISRLKVLSNLDITERRTPQDGRFKVTVEKREVDFRVSVMPNAIGEDAVLRILDRKHLTGHYQKLTLDSLAFEEHVKAFIRNAANLPYGLLLVTGPTGSGKTTTLYAAISEINTGLDKIITIEDPIEYQLSGILQIPVNEKKGLTFAKGLRSVLRHDPDKIMVGEIRDSETAQIAVQAALTGHQVFTTLHANNVFDVIGRFSNMGVDSYSLVAALSGIMAQRLLRTVCPVCAEGRVADEDEAHQLGLADTTPPNRPLLRVAKGCPHCRGTGYKGRSAVAEILHLEDSMKDLLAQHAPISQIKALAHELGFRNLRTSALNLALCGKTTLAEVNRVCPVL